MNRPSPYRTTCESPGRDRLGEAAGRVDGTGQHVGDPPTSGLPAEPRLDHRAGVGQDVAQQHRRAVGQHDHDVRVDGRDGVQGRELVGRQVHVGPVEAFGLVRRGQPDRHDHGVGRTGHPLGLGAQRVVVDGVISAVGRGERDVAVDPAELVEEHVDADGIDL
jgi:hypothetical protein